MKEEICIEELEEKEYLESLSNMLNKINKYLTDYGLPFIRPTLILKKYNWNLKGYRGKNLYEIESNWRTIAGDTTYYTTTLCVVEIDDENRIVKVKDKWYYNPMKEFCIKEKYKKLIKCWSGCAYEEDSKNNDR